MSAELLEFARRTRANSRRRLSRAEAEAEVAREMSLLGPSADGLVPAAVTWPHGGQSVSVSGSFNGWAAQVPLARSGADFFAFLLLPPGLHHVKFVVDCQWRCAAHLPSAPDASGANVNNILDLTAAAPSSALLAGPQGQLLLESAVACARRSLEQLAAQLALAAAARASRAARLLTAFTCAICLEVASPPASTPCGHTFCVEHLRALILARAGGALVRCPRCRAPVQQAVGDVQVNVDVKAAIEMMLEP